MKRQLVDKERSRLFFATFFLIIAFILIAIVIINIINLINGNQINLVNLLKMIFYGTLSSGIAILILHFINTNKLERYCKYKSIINFSDKEDIKKDLSKISKMWPTLRTDTIKISLFEKIYDKINDDFEEEDNDLFK